MKHGIKYGLYLGGVLILINLLYYFIYPMGMYLTFGKTMILEILLFAIFMFFAISKNKNTYEDSGTFFKIALLTLVIGFTVSGIFRYTFSHLLSEQLNPVFLEAKKADENAVSDFVGQDPLMTLESVELMDSTIEDDLTFMQVLMTTIFGILILGIPFSILVSYLSRRILKIRKI